MLLEGPWKVAEMQGSYPDFEYATTEMPAGDAGSISVLGGEDIAMFNSANKDALTKFEQLLDEYFQDQLPIQNGLPSVKYFADKVYLSPNYFGDMVKKETGKTPQEHIQTKVIELAKERIVDTEETVSQIAYSLGFQYPQHLCRLFKRRVGCTPNEYRNQALA